MNSNKHEFYLWSTEYTEETECLADVGHDSEEVEVEIEFCEKRIEKASVYSAVRHASRKRKQPHAEA